MGSLYIDMDAGAAEEFVRSNGGFEIAPNARPAFALYGDDRSDTSGLALTKTVEAPRPYPTVIGYDGMRPELAGYAMKLECGKWVPVARFNPPLSDEEQARANERALDAYEDRCAEYSVKGAVGNVLSAQWEA